MSPGHQHALATGLCSPAGVTGEESCSCFSNRNWGGREALRISLKEQSTEAHLGHVWGMSGACLRHGWGRSEAWLGHTCSPGPG